MWFTFLANCPRVLFSFLDVTLYYFAHVKHRLHSLPCSCHFTIIFRFLYVCTQNCMHFREFFYCLLPHFLTLTGNAMSIRFTQLLPLCDGSGGIGSCIRSSFTYNSFRLHSWGTHTRCGPLEHYDHNHFGGILRMSNCGWMMFPITLLTVLTFAFRLHSASILRSHSPYLLSRLYADKYGYLLFFA